VGDLVHLEDPGDDALEERAVVRDDRRPARPLGDEALQSGEPVEVEVVRRLVEQERVEAREEDRRQRGARRLPARQRGRLEREEAGVEAEVAADGLRARLEVRPAEREPGVERLRVGVAGARGLLAERVRRGVEPGAGRGDPRAAGEEGGERLAGRAIGLLGQVARGAARAPHLAAVGGVDAGEDAQQRRLARAVGADDADHVARGHGDGHPGQDGGGAEAPPEITRDERQASFCSMAARTLLRFALRFS
jgi:hypothetical protein